MPKLSHEFLIQGSEPAPYKVVVEKDGSILKASCTCRAGIFGQLCKHRLLLLNGSTDGIVSPNAADACEVASWLAGSNVAAAISDLLTLEAEKQALETRIKRAKKVVAMALMG